MPVFELNGKKVIYGLDQKSGKPIIDTEDVLEALGYPEEVIEDIQRGAAADVIAEMNAVAAKQFGPVGEIMETEARGHIFRVCGIEREDGTLEQSKVSLSDQIRAHGGEPSGDIWVSWEDWHQFMLTLLANIHCERTMFEGIPVRYQEDPFANGQTVYSVNDIIDSVDDSEAPMPYDDGWIDEASARKLVRIARRGWTTLLTTGKVPDQEALGAMLKDDSK